MSGAWRAELVWGELTSGAAVVTNDIFTKEDQEFLIRNEALADRGRIRAIETGEPPPSSQELG